LAHQARFGRSRHTQPTMTIQITIPASLIPHGGVPIAVEIAAPLPVIQ
jgi:hypothetical protein